MKIILTYDDLDPEVERCLIEWIEDRIADKSTDNLSPLRYVDKLEVEP